MKTSFLPLTCLALGIILTAGCETHGITQRITEKADIFDSITPEERRTIKAGIIMPGYTSDMVYMAFGHPSSTESSQVDGSKVEMWSYQRFYPSGKMAKILTAYSRARNPNLQRSLNLETGKATVNVNAPGSNTSLGATATGQGNDLSLPDLPVYNLYVFFQGDLVVDIKIESLDGTKF